MKPFIALVATIVLSLAFAPAFADDFAAMGGKDLGVELYESWEPFRETPPAEIAAVPTVEVYRDLGIELYEAHLASEAELAERRARGIEAGGVSAKEVEKKFDYLGSRGSDLP